MSLTIRKRASELRRRKPDAMMTRSTFTSSFFPPRTASISCSAKYPPAHDKRKAPKAIICLVSNLVIPYTQCTIHFGRPKKKEKKKKIKPKID